MVKLVYMTLYGDWKIIFKGEKLLNFVSDTKCFFVFLNTNFIPLHEETLMLKKMCYVFDFIVGLPPKTNIDLKLSSEIISGFTAVSIDEQLPVVDLNFVLIFSWRRKWVLYGNIKMLNIQY